MDALSGGCAWIAAGLLACAAQWTPASASTTKCAGPLPYVALLGALSGFLWFNRPPARIFMGDAGSTLLGYFLGAFTLYGGFANREDAKTWLLPLCILAVPLYDISTVVLLRLSQGRSPFHADKQHVSHRLVRLGIESPSAVRMLHGIALGLGAAGLLCFRLPQLRPITVVGLVAAAWISLAAVEFIIHRGYRPSD